MTAIEQAMKWMDLDKRCGGYGGHCLKCDAVLRRKFDTADIATRNFLADTLCSCSLEDFVEQEPLLWLLALLNTAKYEQFVAGIAKLAPYGRDLAWQIIRLSEHNKGNWCFAREPYRKTSFKPRFHLHPAIAPSLLAATISAGTESRDAVALLDYFEPISDLHPLLQAALPLWHAERMRREEERRTEWVRQQEQKRIEAAQREVEWATREAEFQSSRIEHLLKSRVHSAERCACLAQFEHSSLAEKLGAACDSRWSLTYFPESWAEQVLGETAVIPDELRTRLLSKLMRLRRRTPWRSVRKFLLRQ